MIDRTGADPIQRDINEKAEVVETAAEVHEESFLEQISTGLKSDEFRRALPYIVVVAAAIGIAFWPLLAGLPELWMSEDGYFSHGFLIPLISGYVIYRNWDRLEWRPVKPGWLAVPFLFGALYLAVSAKLVDVKMFWAVSFLAALLCGVWLTLGRKWLMGLAGPILYLAFALPIWSGAIDDYTNPLQIKSTGMSYRLLQLFGFDPFRESPTIIYLDHFTLNVAVPCSGLKLLLAVTAFAVFFIMIARLKWWANGLMLLAILPLCLFINGLRIALIGVVGELNGDAAGMAFHDYSGYITLLVCFFILFSFARVLGWKR